MILIVLILSFLFIFLLIRYVSLSRALKELISTLRQSPIGNIKINFFPPKNIKDATKEIVFYINALLEKISLIEKDKKRIESVFKNISDCIFICDVSGTINFANHAAHDMLFIDEKVEGKKLIEVTRNIKILEIFKRAVDQKKIISEEISMQSPYKEIHLIATAIPLSFEDSISDIVITLHDITRLKQLEEIRKDFVANVSHEIKTPLTAIKGFTETLIDGALNEKENALRFLNMIKNHSDRLNRLVDDLLALSRIELGDIKMSISKVNIDNIIETVFFTLREKATQKGLFLRQSIPPTIETIEADRDKLIQILLNLVDNGIKFTEKGGVTVGIEESDGRRTLFVQDTGIGIPQNHIQRLGERFYRVDKARSRELGGTGLGLAIVKHLIYAHGWNMTIQSELGKGTKINIHL